jgi:thiamine pyrophosphate-dependent acetolactate synthase large subunit-like protein
MKMDTPQLGGERRMAWGSDVVAEMLRRLGIKYVCINPGSSFRGLHDSLVNYLGNDHPRLLLALHEQTVVAIAHGFAKAAGEPMAVVLHSNVGLMNGMVSIFNAWCDRAPILVLGATGAVDTALRRSWIDWNHTFRDQGALVRHYVKWDDQPASVEATVDGMLRAYLKACTPPRGPSYVILDRRLQEDPAPADISLPDVRRYQPADRALPSREAVRRAAALLGGATRPVILVGRVSQAQKDWDARIRLSELLGARVVTDLRTGATFPTDHPLHGGPADLFLSPGDRALLVESDVVLSLDWYDLADTMRQAEAGRRAHTQVIQVSIDWQSHNSWSGDHQRLPAIDLSIAVEPDAIVEPLIVALAHAQGRPGEPRTAAAAATSTLELDDSVPTLADIGRVLTRLREGRRLCLARLPLNWPAGVYHFREPLDYLGYDGGGGVGSGPGMAIGAAIALEGSGRIALGIMGDGEFLGAPTALWTAAHYQIPVFIIVANNRSYFTDEIQQEAVARERGRPVENRWIGQRLDDPPADIAGLARDLGVDSEGPVRRASELPAVLQRGLDTVEAGRPYLVDIWIDPSRGANFDWLAGHA